jgi:hypothetical protein
MTFEQVEVMRGVWGARDPLFGPLPGRRAGEVIGYEFELPERFVPQPGRSCLQRAYVLLDAGVGLSDPCWSHARGADGARVGNDAAGSWYVDLLAVEQTGARYALRDLYIDAIVPVDGRHQRMLDLDEFADAALAGLPRPLPPRTTPAERRVGGLPSESDRAAGRAAGAVRAFGSLEWLTAGTPAEESDAAAPGPG